LSLKLWVAGMICVILIGKKCDDVFIPNGFTHCKEYYGSMWRSMYTMWQIVTLESWSQALVRPVIEVRPELFIFFTAWIFITTLGLLNVIVGIIVESTLAAAATDEEKQREKTKQVKEFLFKELLQIYSMFIDGIDHGITEQDFTKHYEDPAVKEKLEALDMPHDKNSKEVFKTFVPDHDGRVSLLQFVNRGTRLRGEAKAKDLVEVVMLCREQKRIMADFEGKYAKQRSLGGEERQAETNMDIEIRFALAEIRDAIRRLWARIESVAELRREMARGPPYHAEKSDAERLAALHQSGLLSAEEFQLAQQHLAGASELERLANLHKAGALSNDEFQQAQRILVAGA